MSEEMLKEIETEIEQNPVILYIKGEKSMPVCGFSARVVEIFNMLNVPFETRNVLASEDRLLTLKEFSGWPTTPQIFVGGQLVGGCDITEEMAQSGDLQKLLEEAGVKQLS